MKEFVESAVIKYKEAMDRHDVQGALEIIMSITKEANRKIEETKPWELAKEIERNKMEDKKKKQSLTSVCQDLLDTGNYRGVIQHFSQMVKILWEVPVPFVEELIAKARAEKLQPDQAAARERVLSVLMALVEIKPALDVAFEKHCAHYLPTREEYKMEEK